MSESLVTFATMEAAAMQATRESPLTRVRSAGWTWTGFPSISTASGSTPASAMAPAMAMRSEGGRRSMMRLAEKLPFTRNTMYQLALSRFTSALATYVASGIDTDTAMKEAVSMVDHRSLKRQLEGAREAMLDLSAPKSLAQAVSDSGVFEPVYARMLTIGARSGSVEDVLGRLSLTFFDDAIVKMDRLVDGVEPALAAFLTVAVGATLVSVMLPLIGIMGSIG